MSSTVLALCLLLPAAGPDMPAADSTVASTPDPLTPADLALPLLRHAALTLGLIDSWEAGYTLVRPEWLANDWALVCNRVAELRSCPPLYEVARFPDHALAHANWLIAYRLRGDPSLWYDVDRLGADADVFGRADAEMDRCHAIWSLIDDATCPTASGYRRRLALRDLKRLLGDDWWGRPCPPVVPVWALRRR